MEFSNRSNNIASVRTEVLSRELVDQAPVWGHDEDDDSGVLRPVFDSDPFLTNYDPLVLKSRFRTVEGLTLQGCVSVSRTFDEVYLVEFFIGDKWFGFNRNIKDLALKDLEALRQAIDEPRAAIFPVHFSTQMRNAADFEGHFTPFDERGEGPWPTH